MSDACKPHHDTFTTLLSIGLILGLFASYAPQYLRIINSKTSEGFSPWFLLLGSTSSAAGMLNLWTVQWGIVRCCRHLTIGQCAEAMGGIAQVSVQWALFTTILVLYLIYYPEHMKYVEVDLATPDARGMARARIPIATYHWKLSQVLAWIVLVHMVFITFTTFFLLLSTNPEPIGANPTERFRLWAAFLGVTSAVLAAVQYTPQLVHTYRMRLVGALSIPMMLIQTPGSAVMILSIALRPGTNWSSWVMFAVSGIMQAMLLIMCLFWKARQRRLGIDDFGNPLPIDDPHAPPFTRVADEGVSVQDAVTHAVEEDPLINDEPVDDGEDEFEQVVADERTPLVGQRKRGDGKKTAWLKMLRR